MSEFVCPPDHKHGETLTCYGKHKCRCGDCRSIAVARAGEYACEALVNFPCARCGITRLSKPKNAHRSAICRDCKAVLTRQEKAAWA